MKPLLCQQNLTHLQTWANVISPGQAIKDGIFDEASNIENAIMQQPSHMY